MVYFMDICDNLAPLIKLIKNGIIPILQVGIPIILIVLGMLDLGKAVVAGKEDEMKKAQSTLVKRCLYAVAVFFVVTIVTLVFGLLTDTAGMGNAGNWLTCWNKF